jgi:hypothetical protein
MCISFRVRVPIENLREPFCYLEQFKFRSRSEAVSSVVHRVISSQGRVLTSEVEKHVVELVAYEVNTSEAVISNLVEP